MFVSDAFFSITNPKIVYQSSIIQPTSDPSLSPSQRSLFVKVPPQFLFPQVSFFSIFQAVLSSALKILILEEKTSSATARLCKCCWWLDKNLIGEVVGTRCYQSGSSWLSYISQFVRICTKVHHSARLNYLRCLS